MGRIGKFRCKSCGNVVNMEIPPSESTMSFEKKVPCTRCGKVGCNFNNYA